MTPGPDGLRPETRALQRRFHGALFGLAAGDALAAATQHRQPGSFAPVTGMVGGGPFNLPCGAWSDETAMALCLADSLVACRGFDARDQVERYSRWQQQGYLSATGECAGITASTARALAVAQWRRQLFSGSHDPGQLDPEPLARVAPVVMYFFGNAAQAVQLAADAARTTCQAPLVLDACSLFAAMLHSALSGQPRERILAPTAELAGRSLRPRLRAVLGGRYLDRPHAALHASGDIVAVLEAAAWAFAHSERFEQGALLAANFGENSDVATAVYGQLAGAFYGLDAIPASWRDALARPDLLSAQADGLLAQALSSL